MKRNTDADIENGQSLLKTTGTLEISGVKNTINMDVEAVEFENGQIRFKGKLPLDMTNYDVEPPEFMLGTISTGKDVVIYFELIFTKN